MPQFEIRQAMATDTDQIFAVHRDSVMQLCAKDYTSEQIHAWLDGRDPTMYLDAIQRAALWVAENDGIVGFVEVAGEEITKLFVRGNQAYAGIGSALLEKAVAEIRRDYCTRAYLESTVNASSFYERHGFVEVGRSYFSHGNSPIRLEIVKMERALPQSQVQQAA